MSSSEHEAWFARFIGGMKDHEETRKLMPLQGKDLGRYLLEDLIGEGASAVVFRARDKELNRLVAVKILKEVAALNPMMRKRFVREAQVVARISHPNVVTVHDVGTKDGISFLVMEFVEGKSLSYALETGMLKFRDRVEIVEKVARGIHAAHGEGVVHRDLKPANIILGLDGEPKVADFGLAHVREPETRLTMSGATLGTPAYMAPEQVRGDIKSIGPKTDVYSLGVILYEMITERIAFPGTTPLEMYRTIIEEEPVPPRKINPDISPDLETICLKAMDRESARRYGSALEFAEDLKRYRKGEPVMARPPSTMYLLRRAIWKRKMITLPILAASVVLVATLAFLLPALQKATEEKSEAEQQAISEKNERERLESETASREAALARARPLLDEAQKIRARVDREMTRPEMDWTSIRPLLDQAEDHLERAVEIFPDYAEALLELGRLAEVRRGDEKVALQYYSRAIAADPDYSSAYIERLQALLGYYFRLRIGGEANILPETEETSLLLKQVREEKARIEQWSSTRTVLEFARGILLFAGGDYAGAGNLLREYAEKMVSDYRAWRWLALIEYARGRPEEAITAANRGLNIRPWYPSLLSTRMIARNRIAEGLLRKGKREEALEIWKANLVDAEFLIRGKIEDAHDYRTLGFCRSKLGDFEGALEACNKAIEIDPGLDGIYLARGNAYYHLKRWDEAARDFSEEILRTPDRGQVYFNRALVWKQKKKLVPLIADLDLAVKFSPDLEPAWLLRGEVREFLENNPLGALEDYRQALKVAPEEWKHGEKVREKIRELAQQMGEE